MHARNASHHDDWLHDLLDFEGENITNVRQENPILSANNPFGANFDSTFVYGPIFGGMYYVGLRFKLN